MPRTASPRRSPAAADAGATVLAINGGSSSLKFALFRASTPPVRVLAGKFERIGLTGPSATLTDVARGETEHRSLPAPDHAACLGPLLGWIEKRLPDAHLLGIGHRVVHGGARLSQPARVTGGVLAELRRLSPYDPEHMPAEIALVEALARRRPGVPQVACFDTAFHHDMPRVARIVALPRRYEAMGVRRYGFHGLSYAFLMEELARAAGRRAAAGRLVLAHLGNGASMVAVRGGRPLDTTMGFTPASGLPMSTRSGDLDPGLVAYLARTEGMTVDEFHRMVNEHAGLLGVSQTSPDVRDLLAAEKKDPRAAEALALFCHQAKKAIGGFAAVLGGLDTLVFAGGIGENAPAIRARICGGLEHLGVTVDHRRNAVGLPVVSRAGSPATVRVIRTDEETQIARSVLEVLRGRSNGRGAAAATAARGGRR